jgi:hypothetical protein
VRAAHRALATLVVRAYLAHVDRTLIAKNLALTVEERFLQLMALQRLAEELRRAGCEAASLMTSKPGHMTLF